ncbi:MAG: ATP-binding protein [Ktedonobacterales bacterium]
MSQLPTGTITFVFTDIEGSTKLLQRLGPEYARVLGEHQALLRAAFAAHGGVEVDTQGDAFLVAFPTAPAAVAAAADATRALAEHAWPEGSTLRVRIGLHTGAPQLVGNHYVGLDVHRAARIAAAGHGGQVLLSQTTTMLIEQDLPAGATLRNLGPHLLKDLQQPEHLVQLILPGLPADFPPLKSLDTHRHNLPIQPTPLLDREEQVPVLCMLLRSDGVHLVTLTGPGGIGKTRLALQVAAELVGDFSDGVWFVRLSRLVDPTLVVPTIAEALGLQEQGSQPIAETLRAHVADKRLLLVLDNFEQVVGAAREVADLLATSPGLRVLVTSRLSLRLSGEREFPLAPLPLPGRGQRMPPEDLPQYAAVALFVGRAQAAKPDFTVTAANAPSIAEICARLDGLPLALELAAARVKVLPPEALLSRLSGGLHLLSGGARDADERQQTMRAAIAWSDALLAPAERVLFWRLAVFVGGGTLDAAEAVCVIPEETEPLGLDLLDGLSELVEQSLVQQREEGAEPRFGMLHVIREYALERLAASGEAEALRRAHAEHFLALAERAEPQLRGPEAGRWLAQLEREHDNLRAALGWAREQGEAELGLRLMGSLWRFWESRGHLREGRAWMDELLEPGSETSGGAAGMEPAVAAGVRARALTGGGRLATRQGDFVVAERWLEEATALGQAAGDLLTAADALNALGNNAWDQGDLERAKVRYEEALAFYRAVENRRGIATALSNLGITDMYQGNLERAAGVLQEALALSRQDGDRYSSAVSLESLGGVARRRAEVAQAAALLCEALALDWGRGDPRRCAEDLEELASTAGIAGQGQRAARLLGAALAVRETLGTPKSAPEQADVDKAVAAARAALGEEAWAAAFAEGHALALEEAVAEALGETG